MTVFRDAPVMRHVERIELPSTSAATMRVRCSVERRFILTIMPERSGIVNQTKLVRDQRLRV
ncbi:MAG TPA: hypothetical protein VF101_06700 [Gaiellaceae bacterium]